MNYHHKLKDIKWLYGSSNWLQWIYYYSYSIETDSPLTWLQVQAWLWHRSACSNRARYWYMISPIQCRPKSCDIPKWGQVGSLFSSQLVDKYQLYFEKCDRKYNQARYFLSTIRGVYINTHSAATMEPTLYTLYLERW